jgi:hypothetical protein
LVGAGVVVSVVVVLLPLASVELDEVVADCLEASIAGAFGSVATFDCVVVVVVVDGAAAIELSSAIAAVATNAEAKTPNMINFFMCNSLCSK